ncbi:hypothetical protein [Methylocystis iwaonis]|uniref:DUF2946 domain-containing protein n=1 Tax=Methylocystis iwaonis TaxID=2885079 RepID=A0ABM8E423_9HYPH|nr:hypothetical protein [Methylocystis iwaonis]BDV32584.1 hypothetical protein SS37A_01130 [Methylocystis iwaonis]
MRHFYDQMTDCLRAYRAQAIICLAMLQVIAFLLSPFGASHVQSDAPGVSLAATQVICANDTDSGDRTHSDHQHECVLCSTSSRDHWSAAVALFAVVAVVLSPGDDESALPITTQDSASRPSLRSRMTLTRGPPAYFS